MPKDLVLCVDDEPLLLRLCSLAIEEAGFQIAVAGSGEAGLETFIRLKEEVCLVLADVVMPGGMNGVEMVEKILEIAPNTKLLMMTGYSDEIVVIEGKRRPPLIRKPFLPDALVSRIKIILDTPDATASSA